MLLMNIFGVNGCADARISGGIQRGSSPAERDLQARRHQRPLQVLSVDISRSYLPLPVVHGTEQCDIKYLFLLKTPKDFLNNIWFLEPRPKPTFDFPPALCDINLFYFYSLS